MTSFENLLRAFGVLGPIPKEIALVASVLGNLYCRTWFLINKKGELMAE